MPYDVRYPKQASKKPQRQTHWQARTQSTCIHKRETPEGLGGLLNPETPAFIMCACAVSPNLHHRSRPRRPLAPRPGLPHANSRGSPSLLARLCTVARTLPPSRSRASARGISQAVSLVRVKVPERKLHDLMRFCDSDIQASRRGACNWTAPAPADTPRARADGWPPLPPPARRPFRPELSFSVPLTHPPVPKVRATWQRTDGAGGASDET